MSADVRLLFGSCASLAPHPSGWSARARSDQSLALALPLRLTVRELGDWCQGRCQKAVQQLKPTQLQALRKAHKRFDDGFLRARSGSLLYLTSSSLPQRLSAGRLSRATRSSWVSVVRATCRRWTSSWMTSGSVTPLLRREVPRSSSDAVTLSRRDDVLDPLSRRGRVHTATGVPVYNRVSTAAAAPLISTSVGCAVAVSLWHRCGITRRWRCRTYCSNRSIFMIMEGVVCPWQYVLGLARDVTAKGL